MRPGGMREAIRRPTGYGVRDTTSRFPNPSYILPNRPAHSAGRTPKNQCRPPWDRPKTHSKKHSIFKCFLAPKMTPKASQKEAKMEPKFNTFLYSFSHRFFNRFWKAFLSFCGVLDLRFDCYLQRFRRVGHFSQSLEK